MRVGLSVLTREGQSIWENGIGQNVFFLAELLETIPFVERVVLLDCGSCGVAPPDANSLAQRFRIIPIQQSDDAVDIVVEVAGGIDPEWLRRFRVRGGKVAFHVCGQPYSSLIEPMIFDRPMYWADPERCDEIWILPKDKIFEPFLRCLHRAPVYEVPYLWAPHFIRASAEEGARHGLSFGYLPGALQGHRAARIAIFEPNISPYKNGIIPFLICDAAERRDNNLIGNVSLLNFAHMREHATFHYLKKQSALQQAGKINIYAREYFAPFMARNANVVLSHQLEWKQNYLYFDAVYGDYPLIHNSPLFRDLGYYYPGSDIPMAVDVLQEICRTHDENIAAYRDRNGRVIASASPQNARNRDAYARRLIHLSHH